MKNTEFEKIYQENAVIVLRYLLSIGCSIEDAEDIVQETFVKAIISIDSFHSTCKLPVWLCQIAKHNYYDLIKKRKKELPNQDFEFEIQSLQQENGDYLELLELIQKMPEPYRTVFMKRELDGYEYSDIAKFFGKTENWARVTFFRAKKKIQKICTLYLKEG